MDELNRLDVEAYKNAAKRPIVVVLDNVRSLHNVGSSFRTADAFGIESLVLCGITACPPHREINKAALGACESVDWEYFESSAKAVATLVERGYRVFGVEQTINSVALQDFHRLLGGGAAAVSVAAAANNAAQTTVAAPEKIAIVFGNEVNGISQEILPMLEAALEIPQYGTKHSMNVSVCVGIVLWELCRER